VCAIAGLRSLLKTGLFRKGPLMSIAKSDCVGLTFILFSQTRWLFPSSCLPLQEGAQGQVSGVRHASQYTCTPNPASYAFTKFTLSTVTCQNFENIVVYPFWIQTSWYGGIVRIFSEKKSRSTQTHAKRAKRHSRSCLSILGVGHRRQLLWGADNAKKSVRFRAGFLVTSNRFNSDLPLRNLIGKRNRSRVESL